MVYPGFGQRGGEQDWGSGAKPPAAGGEEVWGHSPQPPTNFCGFHIKKTLFLTHYFMEKGHAVSVVTTSVARIWQWEGEFENDITFDYKLYTGADPESFGGVHATLN